MTEEELKQIEERASKATEGPWEVTTENLEPNEHGRAAGVTGKRISYEIHTAWEHPQLHGPAPVVGLAFGLFGTHVSIRPNNAEFIAAAREDVPKLVAEVRRLRAFVEANAYESTDWGEECTKCRRTLGQPHKPDCKLVGLLGREPKP